MRIAFVTTCKGRVQHVKRTLPRNLADTASYPNAVFVLLDYGSDDGLEQYIRDNYREEIFDGRLVYYSLEAAGRFRMAHAKNLAHRLGIREGADVLVNMDADNFTGADFAEAIVERMAGRRAFMWARMIHRCNLLVTRKITEANEFNDGWYEQGHCVLPRGHDGDCSLDQRYSEDERPRVRGINGRIVVFSSDYLKAGGYDERFDKWGPDDKDFNVRLQALGCEPLEIEARHLEAIHHGARLRFREYPEAEKVEAQYDPYETTPISCRASAVANAGHFGCGRVFRNFDSFPLEIGPLPTRLFGIGLHKTGTTSLAAALEILGYECAHWSTPRWARTVWEEMQYCGHSLTLERAHAATDLPISVLYRELDRAYPGSKFILTVRDEVDWLRSVRDHWNPELNPWCETWENDCFTHRMHSIVYGRKTFDAVTFLERYRRHNAEVLAYFRHRPDDLLVMDASEGWRALCPFLDEPMPFLPYPKLNGLKRSH